MFLLFSFSASPWPLQLPSTSQPIKNTPTQVLFNLPRQKSDLYGQSNANIRIRMAKHTCWNFHNATIIHKHPQQLQIKSNGDLWRILNKKYFWRNTHRCHIGLSLCDLDRCIHLHIQSDRNTKINHLLCCVSPSWNIWW